MTGRTLILFVLSILLYLNSAAQPTNFEYNPRTYVCHKINTPIQLDGQLDEQVWETASWTENFVDIEGPKNPKPKYDSKVKMLWDEDYLYIAAQMVEPHIWATITERDAIIYQDNDFEVFIDPDGDTHLYYEFEINALGTYWDLMLIKPYRNGGPAINAWDIRGVKSGISIDGTLNDPSDVDRQWTVELAFPWKVLKEAALEKRKPKDGEQWRINFSRVNWETIVENGKYKKQMNPNTGRPLSEHNWVWSPQGVVNMHKPEYWGFVQFSSEFPSKNVAFIPVKNEELKWILRNIYYAEKDYFKINDHYTDEIDQLEIPITIPKNYKDQLKISATPLLFQISIPAIEKGYTWQIREDSKIWKSKTH